MREPGLRASYNGYNVLLLIIQDLNVHRISGDLISQLVTSHSQLLARNHQI